jgi:MFS family permease
MHKSYHKFATSEGDCALMSYSSNSSPLRSESFRFLTYLSISALLSFSIWILLLLPNSLEQVGWSAQKIGWVMGSFYLFSLIFSMVSGQIAQYYGGIRTALFGAGLGILGGLLYLSALWTSGLIFVARACHAAGVSLIQTGALFQLVQSVPPRLRGRMMGYFGLPGFIMLGVGPFFSEWVVYHWGFEAMFGSVVVVFLVEGWILSRLSTDFLNQGNGQEPFINAVRANLPTLKSVLSLAAIFGACTAAWSSLLAPAVQSHGKGGVSNFGLGYGVGAILTRAGISQSVESSSRRLWAISTLFLYCLGLVMIPLVTRSWHLAIAGFVCGMSHGIFYPGLSSIATERFHPLHLGSGLGLYIASANLGTFVGSPIWGAIADHTGYGSIFHAAAFLLAISTIIFVTSEWRQVRIAGAKVSFEGLPD